MPVIDVQIAGPNSEDAREADTGTVGLSNEAIVDATNEYYGMRWTGITIPVGATIVTAWIDIYIIDDTGDDPNHTIYFEDNATPGTFVNTANNISSRTPTTATALLSSTDLGATAAGGWLSSFVSMPFPEIKTIIQELVDSYDYSAGGAMVAIIQGGADGTRDLRRTDWSTDTTLASKLHIEYTTGGEGGSIVVPVLSGENYGVMFGGLVVR